jgi:hypothetical protein
MRALATLPCLLAAAALAPAVRADDGPAPLASGDGVVGDQVVAAFLSPSELAGRTFSYVSAGEEAAFCLDSSLGANEPKATLHPGRVRWPRVAGLELVVAPEAVEVRPAAGGATDADLDRGFEVRWLIAPVGQRFAPCPRFEAEVVGADVFAAKDRRILLTWRAKPRPPVCATPADDRLPACDLPGMSREAKAAALSPDGTLLAVAVAGLWPRLEVYDVSAEPRLAWRALFPARTGGVIETSFSADGAWVVALTGKAQLHRFEARTGGGHLAFPSAGRTARALPPGRVMAVAGDEGEVTLWRLADGTVSWRLPARKLRGPVDRLAASGDGRRFATLEYDAERTVVRVWEVRNRSMLAQIDVDPYAVADIALDGDGRRLFVAHAQKGLLAAGVDARTLPAPFGQDAGRGCKGRLQWVGGARAVMCAVPGGTLLLDEQGRTMSERRSTVPASELVFAAAANGRAMAAVGAGHLLLWRPRRERKDKP